MLRNQDLEDLLEKDLHKCLKGDARNVDNILQNKSKNNNARHEDVK